MSTTRKVAAPHMGCIEKSGYVLFLITPIALVTGIGQFTGRQSNLPTAPFVCSSISFIVSGIVILIFLSSSFLNLPAIETG